MGAWDAMDQLKIKFSGRIYSVQVRSTVWRYTLDNRTHREIGYNIFLLGTIQDEIGIGIDADVYFSVAISGKQMQKLQLRIGDTLQGTAWSKMYPNREYADYYRAGALKKQEMGADPPSDDLQTDGPPFLSEVPDLETYAERGARMLDTRCYNGKCFQCKWAAMANVTIEYDWGKSQRLRFESFCYGPKSCKFYRMGRARAVPNKDWGTCYDDGWIDEMLTDSRGEDD